MTRRLPSVSIVINTLNRGPSLDETLKSLQWLRYRGHFEVIVVNGPSTDNSEEVIQRWGTRIRAGTCPVANLSVSRNIGICMARGEVTAFIDDDAIPEPEWLSQLTVPYSDPVVGGVGGFVFNHTGYSFQYGFGVVDRFGNADDNVGEATPHLAYPNSIRFPHLLGTNSSFRTDALIEIGGFDEEFEYFLDETDVCARIVDAGYLIAQLPNAFIHHKYAPSHIRGTNRVPRYRYPVIKNKIYFLHKHATHYFPMDRVLREQQSFIDQQSAEMQRAFAEGLLGSDDIQRFGEDLKRAVEVGTRRGKEGPLPGAMIDDAKRRIWDGEFSRFVPHDNPDRCNLVLVSKSFPPRHTGGIGNFSKELAEAFAERGNTVHVICEGQDFNRVDFENGVWVHRIVAQKHKRPEDLEHLGYPQHLWDWSASALAEARRIETHRAIDVVEAPVWDGEGIAFLHDGAWPLVTSLHTTLHLWLEAHPEHRTDSRWMQAHGHPVLATEKRLMLESAAVRANSRAIRNELEKAYGVNFDEERTFTIPHGMSDIANIPQRPAAPAFDGTTVLFVGRLEPRKGIDVLLRAIPSVLEQAPATRFRILGDQRQPSASGKTYDEEFYSSAAGAKFKDRVVFEGLVDNATLTTAYQSCDIFVAPSRFESCGLVFVEAMRAGKPVIGCTAGGMPEVIDDGRCGFLVPPGDADQLAAAILKLVDSARLREDFGRAARARYEQAFPSARMAKESVTLYRSAKQGWDAAHQSGSRA